MPSSTGPVSRHDAFRDRPRLRVAITGASGLVGRALASFLRGGGHTVHPLVRRPPEPGSAEIRWDPAAGEIDAHSLEGVDAVVHLAGESVQGRWTDAKKAAIRDSRVLGTTLVASAVAGLQRPPATLVSASAVGYYGNRGEVELDEKSPQGDGFLADVGEAWEGACAPAVQAGIRVVHPRIGVVLSARGGALPRMLPPFRLGLGGPIGSGRQWMSCIDLDDLVGMLHYALFIEALSGPVNATAPEPVTNAAFSRALGRALRRPALLPLPGFAVRLALGEMGEALVLHGARVIPQKAVEAGFVFRYPQLALALAAELGRTRQV